MMENMTFADMPQSEEITEKTLENFEDNKGDFDDDRGQ